MHREEERQPGRHRLNFPGSRSLHQSAFDHKLNPIRAGEAWLPNGLRLLATPRKQVHYFRITANSRPGAGHGPAGSYLYLYQHQSRDDAPLMDELRQGIQDLVTRRLGDGFSEASQRRVLVLPRLLVRVLLRSLPGQPRLGWRRLWQGRGCAVHAGPLPLLSLV